MGRLGCRLGLVIKPRAARSQGGRTLRGNRSSTEATTNLHRWLENLQTMVRRDAIIVLVDTKIKAGAQRRCSSLDPLASSSCAIHKTLSHLESKR
jgi:hypothetical protein